MTTPDALTRLTAALAEDERIARAALEADHPSVSEWDGLESNMFEHTQRHDPARVLRQGEALRAVLELHKPGLAYGKYCETCHDYNEHDVVAWPCPTVRALAGIYDTESGEEPS